VAATIQEKLGLEAEVTKGSYGEFSVRVGGVRVAGKNWLGIIPSDEKILKAVEAAGPTPPPRAPGGRRCG
jgi:hypothetical protein